MSEQEEMRAPTSRQLSIEIDSRDLSGALSEYIRAKIERKCEQFAKGQNLHVTRQRLR